MRRLSNRFSRIVRVRAIEHHVAAARQAAAERRVVELLGVARRIEDLRASLCPSEGPMDGQTLRAMSEMQLRLGRAEGDLRLPIRQAEASHEQAWSDRLAARTREDGAGRLRDRAALGEEKAAQVREDAGRIYRVKPRRGA